MKITATDSTKTHCNAAEIMWDEEKAKLFHRALIRAIGRDCFCRIGESCWMMSAVLKGVEVSA